MKPFLNFWYRQLKHYRARLVDQSFLTPEVRGSNPVVCNFHFLSKTKMKKKRLF